MRYLVATNEMQGFRDNDFCFAMEGELVKLGIECDIGEEVDGECGCRRSMVGLSSSKSTTTMKVAEIDLTKEEIVQEIIQSYEREGWPINNEWIRDIKTEVEVISHVANSEPLNSIIEKRGNILQSRSLQEEV